MRRVLAILLFCVTSAANAADAPKIVDGVACAADPSITYAYYVPSRYTAEQRWPILFVFDPRQRGAFAGRDRLQPPSRAGRPISAGMQRAE